MIIVGIVGVGTWQFVELHREVSSLQTQNQLQRIQIMRRRAALSGLDDAVNGSALSASSTSSAVG